MILFFTEALRMYPLTYICELTQYVPSSLQSIWSERYGKAGRQSSEAGRTRNFVSWSRVAVAVCKSVLRNCRAWILPIGVGRAGFHGATGFKRSLYDTYWRSKRNGGNHSSNNCGANASLGSSGQSSGSRKGRDSLGKWPPTTKVAVGAIWRPQVKARDVPWVKVVTPETCFLSNGTAR